MTHTMNSDTPETEKHYSGVRAFGYDHAQRLERERDALLGRKSVSQPTGKADVETNAASVPTGMNAGEGSCAPAQDNAGSGRRIFYPLLWLAAWCIGIIGLFKLGHIIGDTLGK